MNAKPHTHNLSMEESTGGWTAIRVKYGDQPRHYVYTCWPGWRSRVRRVTKRMVRHHDRQSLKAGRRSQATEMLSQEMTLWERSGTWGRDVLAHTSPPLTLIEITLKPMPDSSCWSLTGAGLPPQYFSYKAAALEHAAVNGYVLTEASIGGGS